MVALSPQMICDAIQVYASKQYRSQKSLFSQQELSNFRSSAVLLPLLESQHDWHVLLTRRSQYLDEHRGQVAFPGGTQERADGSLQTTALREANEEIGLMPEDVTIFGHLGEIAVITGFIVRMFVGQIPWPYELKIAEDEVDTVFTIPLDWLAEPANREIRCREFLDRKVPVIYFKPYQGHQLWGASAEMTMVLLTALGLTD